MGDSDQPLSEYLAQPGGGGAVLPSKIQQALNDALANALDVKSGQEVQGYGADVFVGLYEATVDEADYMYVPAQDHRALGRPDAELTAGEGGVRGPGSPLHMSC